MAQKNATHMKKLPRSGNSKGSKAKYCMATIAHKRREINDRY